MGFLMPDMPKPPAMASAVQAPTTITQAATLDTAGLLAAPNGNEKKKSLQSSMYSGLQIPSTYKPGINY